MNTRWTIIAALVLLAGASIAEAKSKCTAAQASCNLYNSTCCPGTTCSMGPSCTTTALGTQKCVTKCVKEIKENSPTAMRQVTIGEFKAWETGKKSAPAVMVIQEWWGVNEAIKEAAEHLAYQGYRTLIPDIYQGSVALTTAEARHLTSKLNWTVAIRQFIEGVEYLRKSGSKKVGVIGFCQGGGLSFCAAQYANVDVAVPFYGMPNRTFCQPEKIKVPIHIHLGMNDSSITQTAMNNTFNAILGSGLVSDAKWYSYPSTPHAFMNGLTEAGRKLLGANLANVPKESVTTAFARATAVLARYLHNKR